MVKERVFYHIQRHREWMPGERYFIGTGPNDWMMGFNPTWFGILSRDGKIRYLANTIVQYVLNRHAGEGDLIPDLEEFVHNPIQALHLANETLSHLLRLTRELVFEQVRVEHFPELPSRMRCIWLIPHEEAALRYWWKQLPGNNRRILEVVATGKYHRTSQAPLKLGTFSLNELRQRAFTYWAGVSSLEAPSVDDEIIFEGFVEVKAVIEPAKLGLAA